MELKIFSHIPFPALLSPLPLISFTTEEITGCTTETAKGASKALRNTPSCFFISSFTVSVTPWINTLGSSNDFIIFIISFIPSFEINKVNPFSALTAPFPLIFLSNSFIALEVKLLTNQGKLSLAKGIAVLASAFLLKLPNQEPKDPTYWIIVDIWALIRFIYVDILLAKAFLNFVVYLVVRNNSYGNSSSWKFFLVNINIVPVLLFAADFNLINCVIVKFTLTFW